jgi:hypothetical protein
LGGLDLSNYASITQGGDNGPILIPGDAENSSLVKVQRQEPPHFGRFTNTQLEQIITWINAGAKE